MRRTLAALALAAATGVVLSGILPIAAGQDAPAPVVAGAMTAASAVPVKRVVLYTSGVGYFEHIGTIHGDGSTVLSFKTNQINDVLKSLLLQDLDGGRVTGVSYPTLAPLEQTLKSFQVDLSNDPPLADILKQLRGAAITVDTAAGPISGQVLGVEKKDRPIGAGADAKVESVWYVNLVNDAGISPVDLSTVTQLKLDDPELAAEMNKALAALALARDKDKKPVTISFSGQGDHRVRIGYVVETPIWKASYRISLGEAGADGPAGGAGGAVGNPPAAAPAAGEERQKGAADIPADQQGKIQGWAIVDNQTDNDWNDVELSLVSGRPISFIEDLYQPLYVPRPTVQPDLFAGLVPPAYDEAVSGFTSNPTTPASGSLGGLQIPELQQMRAAQGKSPDTAKDSALMPSDDAVLRYPSDWRGVGIVPLASGAKVGEAFQYTVHDVTLARQKSSMIPILAGSMQTQRLSIYNANVLPNNPLLGARLTNTSGGYIMQGPVTVLDHGIYAGDAQILDLPPNATRLISYGVDQRMQVNGGDIKNSWQLLTGKIVKGVLQLSTENVNDQTYIATNKADEDKLLLIEHPRQDGFKLVKPAKPQETTDAVYRFELNVPAGKTASLEVLTKHVYWQAMEILPGDLTALVGYSQNAAIPQPVKDALTKAIGLRQAMVDTDRQLAQLAQDKSDLAGEQGRMRQDMKVVSPGTDYYKKLMDKLDAQESQFEQMETQAKQLEQQRKDQQKQLEDYLGNLNVG